MLVSRTFRVPGEGGNVSKLEKRTYLLSVSVRREYPMAKAFLAPQRDKAQLPKARS